MKKALKKIGLDKDQVIMVGDNYQTDIRAGINFGIDTLLVYTGVSTRQQVAQQINQPTYEVASLDDWKL
jgi:4-nitrophenyl phosphatase